MPTPEEMTIPDKLDSINTTKQAIREAIVAKGVEVPEGTTFYEYAGLIGEISSGGGKEYTINGKDGADPFKNLPLLPHSAVAGTYVPLVAGEMPSYHISIMDKNGLYSDLVSSPSFVKDYDSIPESVKPIFENVPQTLAPPPTTFRYGWFLMPPCDVYLTIA